MTGFYILLRAHDYVWLDRRARPFTERVAACNLLWHLALELALSGGAAPEEEVPQCALR